MTDIVPRMVNGIITGRFLDVHSYLLLFARRANLVWGCEIGWIGCRPCLLTFSTAHAVAKKCFHLTSTEGKASGHLQQRRDSLAA